MPCKKNVLVCEKSNQELSIKRDFLVNKILRFKTWQRTDVREKGEVEMCCHKVCHLYPWQVLRNISLLETIKFSLYWRHQSHQYNLFTWWKTSFDFRCEIETVGLWGISPKATDGVNCKAMTVVHQKLVRATEDIEAIFQSIGGPNRSLKCTCYTASCELNSFVVILI